MADIPAAEVELDAELVSRLVAEQCPHLADPHVAAFGQGWDNELYALGPGLLVRLPRRAAAVPLLEHELSVLPRLAPRLSHPVPVAVFSGRPSRRYPWPWAVVPRLPGHSAAEFAVADRGAAAVDLATFLGSLHFPAAADAPANPFRGVPLAARAGGWRQRLLQVAGSDALARWERCAAAAPWPGPPVWLHGDLHPLNLLLHADGSLAGVIDFGDVCAGDPASDLAVAWLAFGSADRARFRAAVPSGRYDEACWTRAWAWALGLAAVFAQASDNAPALAAIARHGLAETLADPEFGGITP